MEKVEEERIEIKKTFFFHYVVYKRTHMMFSKDFQRNSYSDVKTGCL